MELSPEALVTCGGQVGAVLRHGRMATRQRMSPAASLLLLGVFSSALMGLASKLDCGPISGMGVFTIVFTLAVWLLWLVRPVATRRVWGAVWPFIAFLLWAVFSFPLHPPKFLGLQNLLVMAAFVGSMLLAAKQSRRNCSFAWRVGKAISWSSWLGGLLYALGRFVGGPFSKLSLDPRSFALFALLGLSWYLAMWRAGSRGAFWAAAGITGLIALSLSRVGLAVAVGLFGLVRFRPGSSLRWIRLAVLGLLLVALLYLAISHIEPLRARFFEGDMSMSIGGVAINAMGRTKMWQVTLDSFRESPWIGKGAGSAAEVVRLATGQVHPHSDYLRLLHDYGVVGFGLWLLGLCRLLRSMWQAWANADRHDPAEAQIHLSAFLAGTASALVMVTQNNLAYVFMMAPVGILIGVSLGTPAAAVLQKRAFLAPSPVRSEQVLGATPVEDGVAGS